MTVDNFDQISKELLNFESTDDFYVVEILKRKKDNPDMTKSEKLLDVYEIHSTEELESHRPYIIKKCQEHNARAYIRVNRRSHKKIALEMLREIANRVANNDYYIRNVYHSMLGKFHSDPEKKWIIDLVESSETNIILIYQIVQFFADLQTEYKIPESDMAKIIIQIPTKNGVHLITRPFHLDKFRKQFPDIDVHIDNGSPIYIP